MTTLTISLPDELITWLKDQAERAGRTIGQVIQEILEKARQAEKDADEQG